MQRRPLRQCSPIPRKPGVYRIWNGDSCLYVGHSRNLIDRVSLHLSGDVPTSRVAESMVIGEVFLGMKEMSAIARQRIEEQRLTIDWTVTNDVNEARTLEVAEIRRLKPTLNIAGK